MNKMEEIKTSNTPQNKSMKFGILSAIFGLGSFCILFYFLIQLFPGLGLGGVNYVIPSFTTMAGPTYSALATILMILSLVLGLVSVEKESGTGKFLGKIGLFGAGLAVIGAFGFYGIIAYGVVFFVILAMLVSKSKKQNLPHNQ